MDRVGPFAGADGVSDDPLEVPIGSMTHRRWARDADPTSPLGRDRILRRLPPAPEGSPATSPLDLPAVTAALGNAGIAVVDVADNLNARDGAWRCLPGSFRLARVSQQPAAAFARPGDRPSVDILVFSSDAERSVAQAAIGADGQVRAQGCGVMVDWVATPHVVGARNVLLFIVTDDEAALAAVRTAASSLGG